MSFKLRNVFKTLYHDQSVKKASQVNLQLSVTLNVILHYIFFTYLSTSHSYTMQNIVVFWLNLI